MTQRNRLDLNLNSPTHIELLYDEPVSGKNQFGSYHLYAVKCNGAEYSYFAPDEVHEELKCLQKGDQALITKLAAQRGNKVVTTYEILPRRVKEINTMQVTEHETNQVPEESCGQKLHFETLLESYKEALDINKALGGMIDINRAAITLYISKTKQNGY